MKIEGVTDNKIIFVLLLLKIHLHLQYITIIITDVTKFRYTIKTFNNDWKLKIELCNVLSINKFTMLICDVYHQLIIPQVEPLKTLL